VPVHVYVYVCTHKRLSQRIYVCVRTYIYIYIYIYIYTYINTYIHTFGCNRSRLHHHPGVSTHKTSSVATHTHTHKHRTQRVGCKAKNIRSNTKVGEQNIHTYTSILISCTQTGGGAAALQEDESSSESEGEEEDDASMSQGSDDDYDDVV
jgi:hypothetical protein